jgi:hypothetical protein
MRRNTHVSRTAEQLHMNADQSVAPGEKFVISYDLPSPISTSDFLREFEAIRIFGACEVGFGGAFYFDGYYSHSDLEKLIADLDNKNIK